MQHEGRHNPERSGADGLGGAPRMTRQHEVLSCQSKRYSDTALVTLVHAACRVAVYQVWDSWCNDMRGWSCKYMRSVVLTWCNDMRGWSPSAPG